ncbi:MAG TPA: hypothetical protein VMD55_03010 [Terracidiphilus sp.]|nr:hypothetical protein [Terracidiphilus sp.]
MKHFVSMTILLFATWAALGQGLGSAGSEGGLLVWGPPKAEWPDALPKPTVTTDLVEGLRIGGWPVKLEETKLVEAQEHFGAIVGSRGDASGALAWLCLRGSDDGGLWALWLYSGEIDGPAIGGFQWQRLSPDLRLDRRCKFLDSRHGSVELPFQLRLGMAEAQVEAEIGPPSGRYRDSAVYSHEHSLTLHGEPYTVSGDILITYRSGKVSTIAANHTTSD